MTGGLSRRLGALTALGALGLLMTGSASAVSSGGYSPSQQDCPANADANNAGQPGAQQKDAAVPGCHSLAVNVEDGQGNRYAQLGIDQVPNNQTPHALDASVDGNGSPAGTPAGTCSTTGTGAAGHVDVNGAAGSPTAVTPCTAAPGQNASGLARAFGLYLGADDNLDFGEHDGVSGADGTNQATNGPSDGGAAVVNWHPTDAAAWVTAITNGTVSEVLTNSVPVADAGTGSCADGYCASAQTRQRTVYQGGNQQQPSRDVYDYSTKQWDPYTCSSGDQQSESPQSCGGRSMNDWHNQEAQHVNAEPGVQVYEDPDPQASPLDPVHDSGASPQPVLYPIPSVYAGTCGVTVGGGPLLPTQVHVSTGC